MKKVGFGPQSKNRRQQVGRRAFVEVKGSRWAAFYEFDTHGASPAETAERIRKTENEHHPKWASRMDGFAGVIDVEIVVGTSIFRIVDCTIPGRGNGERVELVVGVREVLAGGVLRKVPGFPVTLRFASIDEIPANDQIIADVRMRLEQRMSDEAAQADYVAQVEQLLGGGA